MRNHDPLRNTGILVAVNDDKFLGSCFCFRYPRAFLTAAHCVKSRELKQLAVVLPAASPVRHEITSIHVHARADIAVLEVPSVSEDDITWPHDRLFDDPAWGQNYMACGYAEDLDSRHPPTLPRVFRGNVQRLFDHSSHLNYQYRAAELSGRSPRGLSGAPVFNPGHFGRLYGLVTENIRTTSELETVVDLEEEGNTYREHYHSVINYGIALWLPSVEDWIDVHIPPVPAEEEHRRSKNQEQLNKTLRDLR